MSDGANTDEPILEVDEDLLAEEDTTTAQVDTTSVSQSTQDIERTEPQPLGGGQETGVDQEAETQTDGPIELEGDLISGEQVGLQEQPEEGAEVGQEPEPSPSAGPVEVEGDLVEETRFINEEENVRNPDTEEFRQRAEESDIGFFENLFNTAGAVYGKRFTAGLTKVGATVGAEVQDLFVEEDVDPEDVDVPDNLRVPLAGLQALVGEEDEPTDVQAQESLYQAGKFIGNEIEELFPTDPERQDEFLTQLAAGGGQIAAQITAGAVGTTVGGAVGGPAGATAGAVGATVGLEGLNQGQAAFEEARQAGASDDEAFDAFLANAGIASLESLPVLGYMRRLDKATGGGLKKVLKEGGESTGRALVEGSAFEATQEVAGQVASNFAAQNIYDESRELLDGAWQAGAIGGILGGAVNVTAQKVNDTIGTVEDVTEASKVAETARELQKYREQAFVTSRPFQEFFGDSVVRTDEDLPRRVKASLRGESLEAEGEANSVGFVAGGDQFAQERLEDQAQVEAKEEIDRRREEALDEDERALQDFSEEDLRAVRQVAREAGEPEKAQKVDEELNAREVQQLEEPQTPEEARRFLAEEETEADARERVVEGYMSIENPLRIENIPEEVSLARSIESQDPEAVASALEQSDSPEASTVAEGIRTRLNQKEDLQAEGESDTQFNRRVVDEALKDQDFDGLSFQVSTRLGTDNVFATFNKGQFESGPRSRNRVKPFAEREVSLESSDPTKSSKFDQVVPLTEDNTFNALWRRAKGWLDTKYKFPQQIRQRDAFREGGVKRSITVIQDNTNRLAQALNQQFGDGDSVSAREFFISNRNKEVPDKIYEDIQLVLNGKLDSSVLPEGDIRAAVEEMRLHTNKLSEEAVQENLVEGNLELVFEKNLGAYLNRAYKIHQPDNEWASNVPAEIMTKAENFVRQRLAETDQPAHDRAVDAVINDILTAEDAPMRILSGGKLGSVDTKILRKRKDIAPEIRALMGQVDDPFLNYARSATKVAGLVENRKFLKDIKERGEGVFFYEASDPNRPKTATERISSEGDKSFEPLDGMFTRPEIKEGFENAFKNSEGFDSATFEILKRANSIAKYSKTVLNQITHVRNIVGGVGFFKAQGLNFSDADVQKAVRDVRAQFVGATDAEQRQRLERMAELGLDTGGARSGELVDVVDNMTSEASNVENFAENFNHFLQEEGSNVYGNLQRRAQTMSRIYQGEDVAMRFLVYEATKNRRRRAYKEAGVEKDETEIEVESANIVRQTYQDYSQVPARIQNLSKNFPIFGAFSSFPSEILRTSVNTMRIGMQEVQSQHKPIRKIGWSRIWGLTKMSMAVPFAVQGAGMAINSIGGALDEAIRRFVPKWDEDSPLAYLGVDDRGAVKYVNPSYYFPHGMIADAVGGAIFGDSDQPFWKSAALSMGKNFFGEFMAPELVTEATFEAVANETRNGAPVYNPSAGPWEKSKGILFHMWKAMEPGAIKEARDLTAGAIEPGNNQDFDFGTKALGAVGFRISEVEPMKAARFSAIDFNATRRNDKRLLTRSYDSDENVFEAWKKANDSWRETFDGMRKDVAALVRMGADPGAIRQTLRDQNISEETVENLFRNEFEPFDIDFERATEGQ